MNDIMIDLETFGKTSNAVVVSIGAVVFDPFKGTIGETFYRVCEIQSQLHAGRSIDESTLKWWLKQNDNAKNVLLQEGQDTDDVVKDFIHWICCAGETVFPWGNGSIFDIGIVESLLNDYGYDSPFKYNRIMDLRTFMRFNGQNQKVQRLGVHHNALDDALDQAKTVIQILGNK